MIKVVFSYPDNRGESFVYNLNHVPRVGEQVALVNDVFIVSQVRTRVESFNPGSVIVFLENTEY